MGLREAQSYVWIDGKILDMRKEDLKREDVVDDPNAKYSQLTYGVLFAVLGTGISPAFACT